MLISSLLISLTPVNSQILGLILATCALVLVILLRRQYLRAIYKNLSDNTIHFRRSLRDWFAKLNNKEKKAAERHLQAIIKISDESTKLLAIEMLIGFQDKGIITKLLDCADDLSSAGKIKFMDLMTKGPFSTHGYFLDRLHIWVGSIPDPSLKGIIHFHLAKQGLLHPDKIIHDLDSHDLLLKGAAIIALEKIMGPSFPSSCCYEPFSSCAVPATSSRFY